MLKYSQICYMDGSFFNTKKSSNKQLKELKYKYPLSDEEYQECHQQLKTIKKLFDLENYCGVEKELKSSIYCKTNFIY